MTPAFPLRSVVVAVDFSPGSAVALARAASLAHRTGATLTLLHADVLFRSGDGAPDASPSSTLRMRVERFAVQVLGRTRAAELDVAGLGIEVVRDVTASAAILRYLSTADAGLLVIGTHGRAGLARLLVGSVAEAVVASAPCPVLAVPERTGQTVPSPRAPVLVAVDFSEPSRAALAVGRALAVSFGAPVEVVHVVPEAGSRPARLDLVEIPRRDPSANDAIRSRLRRFAGGVVTTHVRHGSPSREIAGLAVERSAGAVVMGAHGRTGLARIVGSVAHATMRRAPCPVLTLHSTDQLVRVRTAVRSALVS